MAQVTLTFSAENAVRIQAAIDETYAFEDLVPPANFKSHLVAVIRSYVNESENRVAALAAQDQLTNVDII
jgi:hypothetical protein